MNTVARNDEKAQLATDLKNAAKFTAFLIGLVFCLFICLHIVSRSDVKLPESIVPGLSYVYVVSYTLIAGTLVYYGVDNYDNFWQHYIESPKLRSLISVSSIGSFALAIALLIKKIIAKVTGRELVITAESMLIGYIMMRGLLVSSLATFDPR